MRRALLTSAAVIALSATGASAQVVGVDTLDSIINNIMVNANANFAGIAVNDADINGSININSVGQSAATLSANLTGDTSSNIVTDNSISVGSIGHNNTAEQSSLVGLGAANIAINSDIAGLVNCDVTATGDAAEGTCDFAATGIMLANTTTTTVNGVSSTTTEATQAATTQNFGDVAALAAGAVNSATMNLTENGGLLETGSAASTSNTAASASFSQLTGAGMTGIAYAGNEGVIDGSVTILLNGGNIGFASIGATALGAANTADITATVVGVVTP